MLEQAPIKFATITVEKRGKIEKDWFSLYLILDGSAKCKSAFGEFSVRITDLFSTLPCEAITIVPEEKTLLLVISIDESMFQSFRGHSSATIFCNSTIGKNCRPLRTQILKAAETFYDSASNGKELQLMGRVYELLYLLKKDFDLSANEPFSPNDTVERKRAIEVFIAAHYKEPLTLEAIAEHFHLSPQYFSKYFKTTFGENFLHYLRQVRLDHAVKELITSPKSVTKIAYDNGFPNLNAFNKAFRERYNVSPNQFLKQYKSGADDRLAPDTGEEISEHSQLESITILRNYISYEAETAEVSDEDIIQVSNTVSVFEHRAIYASWKEIINIESAAFCLNSEIQEHISIIQNALKFRYARLMYITSSDIFRGGILQDNINFSRFNRIIEFLHSVNLRPMFELGPRPPREMLTPYRQSVQHTVAAPVDITNSFLKKLLIHSVNRWGIAAVSTWRFEMWTPQTEDLLMKSHTPDTFPLSFAKTYKTIKSIVPDAEVGCMGLNINLQSPIIAKEVMQNIQSMGFAPDFISMYVYPSYIFNMNSSTGMLNIGAIQHSDENRISNKIDSLIKLIYSIFSSSTKIYITEYTSDISSRIAINETCYKSAFIIKTVIDNFEKVAGMGYWLLSDSIYDSDDSSTPLFGGNGLLSRDGLKKPAFWAFSLLDKLGDEMISKGKNYIVTTRQNNMYAILVHNYKNLSEAYCLEYFKGNSISCSDSYFDDVKKMNFQLTLTDVRPGNYWIKKHTLNNHHTLSTGLQELNFTKVLRDEELSYLAGTCVPRQRIDTIKCDHELSISTTLEPNEVTLFIITPISEF